MGFMSSSSGRGWSQAGRRLVGEGQIGRELALRREARAGDRCPAGIGLMHFDEAGQQVEEQRALRRRERRQDAFLRRLRRGAQAIAQRLAARRSAAARGRVDPAD